MVDGATVIVAGTDAVLLVVVASVVDGDAVSSPSRIDCCTSNQLC